MTIQLNNFLPCSQLHFPIYQPIGKTKVHTLVSFEQLAWLKSFVSKNTLKSNKQRILKRGFQIHNYCIFGKTMKNSKKTFPIKPVKCDDFEPSCYLQKTTYRI